MTPERIKELRALCVAATDEAIRDNQDWRPVREVPGYCIDPNGNIYSVFWEWRGNKINKLTPAIDQYGYLKVRLTDMDGSRKKHSVHKLVCIAFHGLKSEGREQVRHLNGDKTDNRPENLRWGSAKENGEDKVALGEAAKGSSNGSSKLKDYEVSVIKEMALRGMSGRNIERYFDIDHTVVSRITAGKSWGHIAAARTALPEALAEIERLRALVPAWQPIETARRDGTPIVALTRGGRAVVISWHPIDGDTSAWCSENEDAIPSSWHDGICWAENADGEESDPPVLWTPLPNPPEEKK